MILARGYGDPDSSSLPPVDSDVEVETIATRFRDADPDGTRFSRVIRSTFDQLYDGQRTGRYSWNQLFKTEKTHFGTIIEINLRREFSDILEDGSILDYAVDGIEVDCKYSFRVGGWMIPPEAFGKILLVITANDESSEYAVGLVRASEENRRTSTNRDGKTGLNANGRERIQWLHFGAELPPNVLLQLEPELVENIMEPKSGQQRINRLFREVLNTRIGRNTVATVAQQDDYMKRVRYNGGAREHLASEGIVILGGDYDAHRKMATWLGLPTPAPGEFVSARIEPANPNEADAIALETNWWRLAIAPYAENITHAPRIPSF